MYQFTFKKIIYYLNVIFLQSLKSVFIGIEIQSIILSLV